MSSPSPEVLEALRTAMRKFADEREWGTFHSPKNLAMALSVEAAELLEQFQWLTEAQSNALTPTQLERVRHELADVLLYLVRLADRLEVDLAAAAWDKLRLNAEKYPIEKARGNAKKYDEL